MPSSGSQVAEPLVQQAKADLAKQLNIPEARSRWSFRSD